LEWVVQQGYLMEALHSLAGHTLACWCDPDLCHGHVLQTLVRMIPPGEKMLPDKLDIDNIWLAVNQAAATAFNAAKARADVIEAM
jgi:hypothetical protein